MRPDPIWTHEDQPPGPVAPWTAGPLDRWPSGPLAPWTSGPLDRWPSGPLAPWTGGPLDHWPSGSVALRVCGPPVCSGPVGRAGSPVLSTSRVVVLGCT
ncbi:unnamed protein product [Merluccius merluccius]